MLIGISFVRYDGKLAKAGGRVVKNVAGYDLMKLMTGAYGSLGIISQVTFRLYPIPDASKTVIVAGAVNHIEKICCRSTTIFLNPYCPGYFVSFAGDKIGVRQGVYPGGLLSIQSAWG